MIGKKTGNKLKLRRRGLRYSNPELFEQLTSGTLIGRLWADRLEAKTVRPNLLRGAR
jgi:hypothetical protein